MSETSVGQLGRTLGGRYELVAVIGSGASAEVYHAKDLRLGRSVAVKQLRAGFADDPRFLKLFRSEATLAAQLTHPNIMTVYDWSDDVDGADGGPYLVTQLLSGGTLRGVLNEAGTFDEAGGLIEAGTLSLSQVAFIGLQAAQGLAFAHEQGLVHRDVKPANLMFGQDGRIHIGDFGIARAVAEAAWTEPEGVLIGTARYAAPEQATEALIDGVADVYSLTLCLIEALTARIPLVRENALSTMVQRQRVDVPVEEAWGPLAPVLAAGGRADPAERATSAQFLDGLYNACRSLPDPEPLALLDLTFIPDRPTGQVETVDDRDTSMPGVAGSAAAGERRVFDGEAETGGPTSKRRRSGRVRWLGRIALALVLAVLAAGAVYGGMLYAQSRQETATIDVAFPTFTVDDYSSVEPDELRARLERWGWPLTVTEKRQDGTLPGSLLSQSPAPGTVLGPGSGPEFELVYSMGAELRAVPELVGQTKEEAADAIELANLTLGEETLVNDENVPAGVVMSATIGGESAEVGSEVETGTVVDLTVSSGPAQRTVPDISAMTLDQAKKAIDDMGLTFSIEEKASMTVAEGAIISQAPAAGTKVDRGKAVAITVSTGLPYVTIPDVVGMTTGAASARLEDLGLEVTGVEGTPSRPVSRTEPAVGQSIRYGSRITLFTS